MSAGQPRTMVLATTALQQDGSCLARANLDSMVERARYDIRPRLFYMDGENTLPPIAHSWGHRVEPSADGGYKLVAEVAFWSDEAILALPDSPLAGMASVAPADERPVALPQPLLVCNYDPADFDEEVVASELARLQALRPVSQELSTRQGVGSRALLRVLFSHQGSRLLDGTLSPSQEVPPSLGALDDELGQALVALAGSNRRGQPADIIFDLSVSSALPIEAALEEATDATVPLALAALPRVTATARHLLAVAPDLTFLAFLYNPREQAWQVNYLLTSSPLLIYGPRYYLPDHPLHDRYERMYREDTAD